MSNICVKCDPVDSVIEYMLSKGITDIDIQLKNNIDTISTVELIDRYKDKVRFHNVYARLDFKKNIDNVDLFQLSNFDTMNEFLDACEVAKYIYSIYKEPIEVIIFNTQNFKLIDSLDIIQRSILSVLQTVNESYPEVNISIKNIFDVDKKNSIFNQLNPRDFTDTVDLYKQYRIDNLGIIVDVHSVSNSYKFYKKFPVSNDEIYTIEDWLIMCKDYVKGLSVSFENYGFVKNIFEYYTLCFKLRKIINRHCPNILISVDSIDNIKRQVKLYNILNKIIK